MIKPILFGSLLASACSLPVVATAQPPPGAPTDSLFFVTTSAPLKVDVLRGEGVVPGGVVKDKPYAADSITESTQVLADGNRITHRNQSRFYRDSQGRTRREQTVSALGVFQSASEPLTMITINDPIAGATYFLDPVAHTARKLPPLRLAGGDLETFERAVPPPGDTPSAGTRVESVEGGVQVSASRVMTFERRVMSPQPGPEPGAAAAGVVEIRQPGPANAAFGPGPVLAPFPPTESRSEDLGKQVLEGVLAHGTRETSTIPAGAVGNERPIEISTDTWYSDELEAVVLSKTSDPRFGETSYRLVNVVRGEPAPDLFAVPQGYEVQTDGPSSVGVRVMGPGEPPPGARVERRAFFLEHGPPKQDK